MVDITSWNEDQEPELRRAVLADMQVYPDFITEKEENALLQELEPVLRRMRYEFDHWDNVSIQYQECDVKYMGIDCKTAIISAGNPWFPWDRASGLVGGRLGGVVPREGAGFQRGRRPAAAACTRAGPRRRRTYQASRRRRAGEGTNNLLHTNIILNLYTVFAINTLLHWCANQLILSFKRNKSLNVCPKVLNNNEYDLSFSFVATW